MLAGRNPYELIGRGLEFEHWPLIYPVPALIAVMPFTLFDERLATTAFVAVSTFMLAYGATRHAWHLLPLFASDAFMGSARLGQWSIIFTAALFFPWLCALAIAKLQSAIPVLLSTGEARAFKHAFLGGAVLLAASFLIMPDWTQFWWNNIRATENMEPPIARTFGFLVVAALIKWRRPEAWLLVATACLPQSWGWYGTLALFTIPRSLTESLGLVIFSSIGVLLGAWLMPSGLSESAFYSWVGATVVFSVYLPCLLLVLSRGNTPESPPAWIGKLQQRRLGKAGP